jgi:hypothetical protein
MSDDKTIDLQALRGRGPLPRLAAAPDRSNAATDPNSDEEECRAFGYLRGIRDRALSLEFRFADGHSLAFPYTWLGTMKYQPSAGILLKFNGDEITLVLLEGSNLNALVNGSVSLYDRGLQRHRVTWVREMHKQEVPNAREGEVTVRCIRMLSHRHGEEPKGVEWLQAFDNASEGRL